jgi:hypothetical protein
MAPGEVLPDQADGHGSLVWVELGHVEVINKVHKVLSAWWPIVDASLLLKGRLEHLQHTLE